MTIGLMGSLLNQLSHGLSEREREREIAREQCYGRIWSWIC